MRRLFILLAILLLLCAAGLALWLWWPDQRKLAGHIPPDALWVYEHPNAGALWEKSLATHGFVDLFSAAHDFAFQEKRAPFWKTWIASKQNWTTFLSDLPIMVSSHDLGNGRNAWMVYLTLNKQKTNQLQALFSRMQKNPAFRAESYTYKGETLYALTHNNGESLHYLSRPDYLIASFHDTPLKHAIDARKAIPPTSFEGKHTYLSELPQLSGKDGTLLLDVSATEQQWQERLRLPAPASPQYAVARLEAHVFDDEITLTGLVAGPDSSLMHRKAGFVDNPVHTTPYLYQVPQGCMLLRSYAFGDAHKWNVQKTAGWEKEKKLVLERRLALFSRYGIDIDPLFRLIGHVAARLRMHVPVGNPTEEVFMLHLLAPEEFLATLNAFARQIGSTQIDYQEEYLGHQIQFLELPELPYLLFGEDFKGFSELFYTQRHGFFLASPSLLTLRNTLDQLENETSWSHLPNYQKMLNATWQDAHESLYVDLSRYWPHLVAELRHPWFNFFESIRPQQDTPLFLSLQKRILDDKQYLQLQLQGATTFHKEATPLVHSPPPLSQNSLPRTSTPEEATPPPAAAPAAAQPLPASYDVLLSLPFDSPLLSPPLLCYNPNQRGFDLFVQEEASFLLHAFKANGTPQWKLPLQEAIISPIYWLDYKKNKRSHYLFATTSGIYVVNAAGEPLQGFPSTPPQADSLAFLQLVDYNKNKNYRFFVADVRGKAYVLDKQGQALAGWAPKTLSPLAQAPFHKRIGQRDCMILPQKNAEIQLYKRIGQPYPNFPLRLGRALAGPLVIKGGTSLRKARGYALNTEGEFVEFSLEAKVLRREALFPSLAATTYRLLPNTSSQDFLLLAANQQRLAVANAKQRPLFELDLPFSPPYTSQYYALGNKASLFILRHSENKAIYFYDLSGKEALPSPLHTTQRVALTYSQSRKRYKIYLVQEKRFLILSHAQKRP